MTNMMTAQMPATSTTVYPSGMPDDLTSPPFAALQLLAQVRGQLDETISVLIGQLQPYIDDSAVAGTLTMRAESEQPNSFASSALERRIVEETNTLRELHARLTETARLLRL